MTDFTATKAWLERMAAQGEDHIWRGARRALEDVEALLNDGAARVHAEAAPSNGLNQNPPSWPDNVDWPEGARFTFQDDPGEHDPCYVVMPGGAMLPLNHHAGEGVDVARAHFIINACNAALFPAQPPSLTFSDERAPPNPQEAEGWLPIVLCPTDGVNRALLLPDGEEVVGSFGEPSNRWRVWRASIPIPSRPLEPIGGVLRETAPYRMRVVSDLPTNVYPTHFRPNDTVFGRPAAPNPQGEGRGE